MGASQVVGATFVFIGEVAVTIALYVLFWRVKYFIPTQGSSRGDYTTKAKKLLPVILGLAAFLAKIISLGLNSWDRSSFLLLGQTQWQDATWGLFGLRVDTYGSLSYASMCGEDGEDLFAVNDSACHFLIFGAIMTVVSAFASLAMSIFVLGHGILFFFRPERMPQYIFRTWRVAACCWPITVFASNTWGGVAHLSIQAWTSSGVSWSYQGYVVAFFIEWFIYLFYLIAVRNTPEFGDQRVRVNGDTPLSDSDALALQESQARIRELEAQLEREKAANSGPRDPNSVMLHPSIPVVPAQIVQPVPVAAAPSWPHTQPAAPAASPYAQSPSNDSSGGEFYSSYQPPTTRTFV